MVMLQQARQIITKCEAAFGRTLSDGERRDLLKDNTEWHSSVCDQIVEQMRVSSSSPVPLASSCI